MAVILSLRASARSPYVVTALPWHLRLLVRAARIADPRRRRQVTKHAKSILLRLAPLLSPKAEGTIELHAGGQPRIARFRAANLHFSWQYQPEHAGGYEVESLALLSRLIGPRDTFYDIGSNWGYFTQAIAARPGFAGQVHAFEASPETYADLVSITRQFGLDGVVKCHHLGISDRHASGRALRGHSRDSGTNAVAENGEGAAITLAPLDALDLPDPAAIKIDVEGHERQVLAGAAKRIARARPFIVVENWVTLDDEEQTLGPLRLLAAADYAFFLMAWQAEGGDAQLRPRLPPGAQRDAATLALAPIDWRQRLLYLRDMQNVFACPRERIGQLETAFGFNARDA